MILDLIDVFIASLLVLIAIGISVYLKLGLAKTLVIASIRTIAQLSLIGLILAWVFAREAWYEVLTILSIMTLIAAISAKNRIKRPYRGLLTDTLVSLGVATGVVTLVAHDFDYSGGAHPNTVATALLWDKTEKRRISPADLFAKGADLSSLERALCDAVNTAKKARPGAVPIKVGDMWACPKLKDLAIVLAPGDAAGKAGGLTFLLDAYAVGPYAEGPYYLTLPASTFQTLLAPAYASEFGGKPLKAGDVTNDLRPK